MLQARPRLTQRGPGQRRGRRALAWLTAVLLAAVVLVACADDEDDRQFANDPVTPRPTPTVTAVPTRLAASPVPDARPVASPETLVESRNAPATVYGVADETLWAFSMDGATEIATGGIVAFAATPEGDRVAVARRDGEALAVEVRDAEGALLAVFEDVGRHDGAGATPVVGGSGVSLGWSPDGERLLVALAEGTLLDVPLDGEPVEIATRAPLTGIEQAAWSPRGDTIGAVIRDGEGNGSLALIDPGDSPARVSIVAPIGPGKTIEAFAWKPDGSGALFLEAKADGDGSRGGMLVAWDRATNSTQIMATGGQDGPTGAVAWFHVAPDGKAVAYGVTIAGPDGRDFSGLYVRSLIDGQVYRVPVGADPHVSDAWWLADGIAWAAADPEAPEIVTVTALSGEGERVAIAAVAPARPAGASPAATPAGLSLATPVATPMATPVGTPAATPIASPAATPAD